MKQAAHDVDRDAASPRADYGRILKFEALWEKVERDHEGRRALAVLRRDGFHSNLPLPVFATIPNLPNRRAKSNSLPAPKGAARAVINYLRDLERHWPDLYLKNARSGKIYYLRENLQRLGFDGLADDIERIFACEWVGVERGTRASTIAVLARSIRQTTGKPHYRELLQLLGSIFAAAGKKLDLQDATLRKIVRREDGMMRSAQAKLEKRKRTKLA